MEKAENRFVCGLRDGVPIGLGYVSVSFTFGIMAVMGGLPVWAALLISMTNLTSAGQFAGLNLMLAGGSYFEVAATQLVINMRYALMSVSVSQKLKDGVGTLNRMGISYGMTDEIFAVATTKPRSVGPKYMYGLIAVPYIGWSLGTLLGAMSGMILPESIRSAMGIAIYGMFIAIVMPPSRESRAVLAVTVSAALLSAVFYWIPVINNISSGFAIIICTLVCAGAAAVLAPIPNDTQDNGENVTEEERQTNG